MGNYNDALLEQLADKGDGFYAYVNTLDEARAALPRRLTSTLQSVALDAKAQVEFDPDRRGRLPPGRVREPRRRGRRLHAIDGVDAGAIGAGHAVTALYALRLRDGPGDGDRLAEIRLRWTDPDDGRTREAARDVRCRRPARARSSGPIRTSGFDAIVAATAEVLRDSEFTDRIDLDDILQVADEDADALPRDR